MEGEEDELVAAVADENVAAVDLLLYDFGDTLQDVITAEMSVRVVDLLEVVDVEDGIGERKMIFFGKMGELAEARLELQTIECAREKVVFCLLLRLLQFA